MKRRSQAVHAGAREGHLGPGLSLTSVKPALCVPELKFLMKNPNYPESKVNLVTLLGLNKQPRPVPGRGGAAQVTHRGGDKVRAGAILGLLTPAP